MTCCLAVLIFGPAGTGSLRGQSNPFGPPASEGSDPSDGSLIDSGPAEDPSLELLSRDQYSRRQQATLEMWRNREHSREQVQEAARHPDPEVSVRAKWILRQWRRGALPDTPPEIARLLQASDGPAAIERLLEAGQLTAAVVAIEESAGTVDREAIQARIASALRRRFPIYVHHALVGESLPDLLRLVDLVADSKELALCRVELMQQMGMEIREDNLLPSSSSLWPQGQREQAESLLWVMLGDYDRAIQVASKSVYDDLLHQCRMIAGEWGVAASESAKEAKAANQDSYEQSRLWCLTLIAAERSGNEPLRAEAIRALRSIDVGNNPEGDLANELRWKCLASHGEVDAALEIASKTDPSAAASICLDAGRVEQAFDALGFPLDRIDLDLSDWVDKAIESQRQVTEANLSPEIRRVLALMQCLIAIGRDDAAWWIAKTLCEAKVSIDTLRLREFALSTLTMTRRSDWVVSLALADDEKTLSPQSYSTISRVLPDCDLATLEIMVQSLTTILRGSTLRQRVQAAATLFQGEIPDSFDPETDFREVFDFVTSPRPTQTVRGFSPGEQRMLANLNLVSFFARHGETALAMQCLQRLAGNRDADALFFLAEQELDQGRTEEAKESFREVFEIVENQIRITGRFGGTEEVALAVKAKIGLWTIARRNGDELARAELEREIRLALCSPSIRLRSTIAEYLADREENELAMEAFARVLPVTVFPNDEQVGLYDVARVFAPFARKSHPDEAARWFDLAIGGTLDSIDFRPGAYITLPLFVRRWCLEAALERDDAAAVEQHLQRIMQLDLLDIDFAERLLPEMRSRGMDELADHTLDQIIDRGVEYGRRFPFDAMTCNNVAWVAAMNGRRLDEALELAENAVDAEPSSAIYRDTLAEVLFLLGRREEALQIERACLLDDPGQWHLHEQIDKYSQAIRQDAG